MLLKLTDSMTAVSTEWYVSQFLQNTSCSIRTGTYQTAVTKQPIINKQQRQSLFEANEVRGRE
jgi:hypothetical protein